MSTLNATALGKRDCNFAPLPSTINKRQKLNEASSDTSDVKKADLLQMELKATVKANAKQVPLSAPNSANGSNNLNPTLDIQVTLPRGHESDDEGG